MPGAALKSTLGQHDRLAFYYKHFNLHAGLGSSVSFVFFLYKLQLKGRSG
jgi:hypothetical protein